jgi:hypothetical protein
MLAPALRSGHVDRLVLVVRVLAVVTAALLAIDAYVHFHDAHFYDFAAGGSVTQGDLFRVQAGVAVAVAVALLVRPHWLVWTIAVLVAASAAGAVYLYTYVNVGTLGPLPNMYEPIWAQPGKRLAAAAETAATVTALVGLVITLPARTPFRRKRPAGRKGADE